MTRIVVTPAELLTLADQVNGANQSISEETTGLEGLLAAILGTWIGEAADSYKGLFDQWNAGRAKMQTGLGQMETVLRQAAGNHQNASSSNLAMWR